MSAKEARIITNSYLHRSDSASLLPRVRHRAAAAAAAAAAVVIAQFEKF